ncbi:MAG: excinuclease ABC subunit UvrA [Epsilonproteobacteria bacterium]|nr:MAG: excinuclease ABC subunit UvrA [Campylobacterota bacterium]RLA65725.1 MAG: excinuclease ABC subunit UvrA [Campylobacterota bacterium]
MAFDQIKITKARVHNLKDVTVSIPKNTLTVITGPSGSGKSSLAFDTIYVEGQRRYIESLSSYARQFLGQFQPPDVESISGLSPAIAIDQKSRSKNPRSTVGTVTEIYDYLRVLFARAGTLYDPESGVEIRKYTPNQIVKTLLKLKEKTKVQILAPINIEKKSMLKKELSRIMSMGFSRARINTIIKPLDSDLKIKEGDQFEIVVDRILVKKGIDKRLADSIEHALKLGNGKILALIGESDELLFSEHNMSPTSGEIYPDLEPRLFSFNSPIGACPDCNGLGEMKRFEKRLMISDKNLTLSAGAIVPLTKRSSFLFKMVIEMARQEKVELTLPYKDLPQSFKKILWDGSDKIFKYSFKSKNSTFEFKKSFPGLLKWYRKKFMETGSERLRKSLETYMRIKPCRLCEGKRLNKVALSTKLKKNNIYDIANWPVTTAYDYFKDLKLTGEQAQIAKKLIKEITTRLKFLIDVGLGYLNLNRAAMTLSGGESQRIRLATQIGSALSGVLYVLDEPSIGLHQRDNQKLIKTLKSLRDLGNTVLVVEHDEETIENSDYIIDMGPGAGLHGGKVVAKGSIKDILKNKVSITAKFMSGREKIYIPESRRTSFATLELKGATQNNIKNLDLKIPLGGVVCVTGVSGSGKSTLIHEILVPAIKEHLANAKNKIIFSKDNYKDIEGLSHIDSVIELTQSPIGRTPKSNPATYSGVFSDIRELFSVTPESKVRGYRPGRFSFNVKGGRCEECEGNGVKKIEMHFLPDVYITCNECKGKRYNPETLHITYKGKNISDILDMGILEAQDFFKNYPRLNRILTALNDVGLGYMKLGQPATTLSGGEAQRLKLASELSKRTKGHCLYVLDEPTTGLHFADIKMLLKSLHELVEKGNTVIIIEHNLDVIKTADHLIDLGPDGGDQGGKIIAQGRPEKVALSKSSHTAKFLKKILKK